VVNPLNEELDIRIIAVIYAKLRNQYVSGTRE
jgi:hypothetical protein